MTTLPKSIAVFGVRYKVRLVSNPNYKGDGSSSGNDGIVDHDKKEIQIDKELSHEEKVSTLIHEMFHVLVKRLSLYQVIDSQLEEVIADGVAAMISENFNVK